MEIPDELRCRICDGLLREAVLVPCCKQYCCDSCMYCSQVRMTYRDPTGIRTKLLDNRFVCPLCKAVDVSPDSLEPDRAKRQEVQRFSVQAATGVKDDKSSYTSTPSPVSQASPTAVYSPSEPTIPLPVELPPAVPNVPAIPVVSSAASNGTTASTTPVTNVIPTFDGQEEGIYLMVLTNTNQHDAVGGEQAVYSRGIAAPPAGAPFAPGLMGMHVVCISPYHVY